MTRSEFKKKIIKMFQELENNENTEIHLQLVIFEDDVPIDIEIATNSCTICHRDALDLFIKQENIQHISSDKQQVH